MSLPGHHRLFVAINVPQEISEIILSAQTRLKAMLPQKSARWTRSEQFHLTLRFLGDIETARIEALEGALRTACSTIQPLHLKVSRIGAFPNFRRPRVLWAGVESTIQCLAKLHRAVEAACHDFALPEKEGTFHGHITLARIKDPDRKAIEALGEAANSIGLNLSGEWIATEVELMRSELSSAGARHSRVEVMPLAGKVL